MRRGLWLGLLASAGGALAVSALPDMSDLPEADAPAFEPAARRSAAPAAAPTPPVVANAPAATQTTRFTGPWPPLSPAARAAWSGAPAGAAPVAPAAAPVTAASAAVPPAPPFPYAWLGQIEQDGHPRFFLANPARMLVVAEGEEFEGWRVGGLRDGRLQAIWLATEETVSLAAK